MKAAIIAGCVVLSVLSAPGAHASSIAEVTVSERVHEPESLYHPILTQVDHGVLTLYKNLPPLKYDHSFNGRLKVVELRTVDDVRSACRLIWSHLPNADITKVIPTGSVACAVVPPILKPEYVGIDCLIYRPPDLAIWESGLTPNILMRHEIGHCNGWRNHEGIRGEVELQADRDRKLEEAWKEWQKNK
jgi:hypothetical protein